MLKTTIKKILKKYKIELTLLFISFIFSFLALFAYLNETKKQAEKSSIIFNQTNSTTSPNKIFVDVSGAVKKPNLYQLPANSRLKEAINIAGGLADEADKEFFQRYFNLAQIIHDQEKIYIPTTFEVANGLVESYLILPYWQNLSNQNSSNSSNQTLVNINQADINELDQLPGIGKITAQKIIDNRPYTSIEDLLNKKIVNSSVFEQIKALITL